MTKIVAFTGPAGSGKTTAADALVSAGWVRVKFASTLKKMARCIGLSEEHIEGSLKESPLDWMGGKSPRFVMQTLGTEWGRKLIDEDLWVSIAKKEISKVVKEGYNVVVDDCRFENEAKGIRDLGGEVVGIQGRGGISGAHESEAGVSPDWYISNTGDAAQLAVDVVYIFNAEEEK